MVRGLKGYGTMFLSLMWMFVNAVPTWSGGISLGMSGAVRKKINDLAEKVTSQENGVGPKRSPLLGKFEPPDGKILLIIGQDKTAHDQYITDVGNPGGLMFYTSVQRLEGIKIPVSTDSGTWDFPVSFSSYPNTALQLGLWMSGISEDGIDDLDLIAAGTYDSNLDTLGNWIRMLNRPVYLRVGYEFDNPGFNYNAAKYVWAYKHVVDHLGALGVTNIAYVWHSYAASNSANALNWYPGDDYVDWVGISFFSTGNISAMNEIATIAEQHHKPLLIAESTPYGIGTLSGQTSWDNWFVPYFDFIAAKKVKAISYINWDWETIPMFAGQGWGNCRIQNNVVVKLSWLSEIAKTKYLSSTNTLFNELGY